MLGVSMGEFHCGKPWFDQGECRSQLCHVHPAGGVDELEELQRSGVLQRESFHVPSYHIPLAFMDSNFTQSRRLFAHTGGLTGSPPHSKVAPLPMLNQSNEQTEDGHAMMKSDTFHSSPNLSDAVRGCHNNCRKMCTNVTTVC